MNTNPKKRSIGKTVCAILAVLLVLSGAELLYSNLALTVSRYTLRSEKVDSAIRIVFLSDLHGREFGTDNERLLKKIAGELLIMAQSGQYNYVRAKKRLDIGAGKLSINKFVNSFIHFVFLINEVYMPYYKWQFKSLKLLSWPNLLYGNLIYDNLINLLSVNKDNIFTVEIENMLNELSNICIDRLNIDKLIFFFSLSLSFFIP